MGSENNYTDRSLVIDPRADERKSMMKPSTRHAPSMLTMWSVVGLAVTAVTVGVWATIAHGVACYEFSENECRNMQSANYCTGRESQDCSGAGRMIYDINDFCKSVATGSMDCTEDTSEPKRNCYEDYECEWDDGECTIKPGTIETTETYPNKLVGGACPGGCS